MWYTVIDNNNIIVICTSNCSYRAFSLKALMYTPGCIILYFLDPSEIDPIVVISEEFEADNVTVTVEWTQQEGAAYQIIIVPQIPINFTGETSIQLILPYNTNYNLSVKSALPCQHQAQSHVLLFYGEFNDYKSLTTYVRVINCRYCSKLWISTAIS